MLAVLQAGIESSQEITPLLQSSDGTPLSVHVIDMQDEISNNETMHHEREHCRQGDTTALTALIAHLHEIIDASRSHRSPPLSPSTRVALAFHLCPAFPWL